MSFTLLPYIGSRRDNETFESQPKPQSVANELTDEGSHVVGVWQAQETGKRSTSHRGCSANDAYNGNTIRETFNALWRHHAIPYLLPSRCHTCAVAECAGRLFRDPFPSPATWRWCSSVMQSNHPEIEQVKNRDTETQYVYSRRVALKSTCWGEVYCIRNGMINWTEFQAYYSHWQVLYSNTSIWPADDSRNAYSTQSNITRCTRVVNAPNM